MILTEGVIKIEYLLVCKVCNLSQLMQALDERPI